MKLSEWASEVGISYITAWRWYKNDKLPQGVKAYKTKSGTIIVERPKSESSTKIEDISPIDIVDSISKCYTPGVRDKIVNDERILLLVSEIRQLIGDRCVDTELNKIWITIASIQIALDKLQDKIGQNISPEEMSKFIKTDETLEKNEFLHTLKDKMNEMSDKIKNGERAKNTKGQTVGFSRTKE